MRQKNPAANRKRTRTRSEHTGPGAGAIRRIAKSLKAAGVVKVNVRYLTEGDQVGFIFEPFDRRGKMVNASAVANAIAVEAECLLWFRALQERRFPGWSSGAGGFGVFEWDLRRTALTHYHHARTVNVKTTRRDGF